MSISEYAKKRRAELRESILEGAKPVTPAVRLKNATNSKTAHIFDRECKFSRYGDTHHVARCNVIESSFLRTPKGDVSYCPNCGTKADFDAVIEQERQRGAEAKRKEDERKAEEKKARQEKRNRLDSLGVAMQANCGEVFDTSTIAYHDNCIEFARYGRKYIITEAEE